jgi:hypothetical protein
MGEKGAGGDRWQRFYLMVIYALCVLALAGLGFLWARQQGWFSAAPVVVHAPETRLERPIEINTAKASDLMQIRGIGERRAAEILFRRDALIRDQRKLRVKPLGWRSIDDFMTGIDNVTGLTSDIKDELRELIRVEPLPK